MSTELKLIAHCDADLQVISALVQDAVLKASDMAYLDERRIFAIVVNRFKWEAEEEKLRVRSGLRFHGVTAVKHKNMPPEGQILSLLALRFTPIDGLAGQISLVFSASVEICLDVEACEVILEDIGAPWPAQSKPQHQIEDDGVKE